MKNILKTLIYNDELSLTLIDGTEIIKEGVRLHGLDKEDAISFGKTLIIMAFMSACLKEKNGEISVSVKSNKGNITVSGNSLLNLRGFIDSENEDNLVGDKCYNGEGTITIIRDDGYSRPFVGSCELPESGNADDAFEDYFKISEQIPTIIHTDIETDDNGNIIFGGGIIIQNLPFASEESINKIPSKVELKNIVKEIKNIGLVETAKKYFSLNVSEDKLIESLYKCNCSREYLSSVIMSLRREEIDDILRLDGQIKIHCHYCNKDYIFTKDDIDKLFKN